MKQAVCIEDIDYRAGRGIEKSQMVNLASGDWIRAHQNLLICGPTGVSKSYLACALGNQACRQGLPVLYLRAPRVIEELRISHADGSYSKRLARFAKTDLIVMDDWALSPLTPEARNNLLEILDDRMNARSYTDRESVLYFPRVTVLSFPLMESIYLRSRFKKRR